MLLSHGSDTGSIPVESTGHDNTGTSSPRGDAVLTNRLRRVRFPWSRPETLRPTLGSVANAGFAADFYSAFTWVRFPPDSLASTRSSSRALSACPCRTVAKYSRLSNGQHGFDSRHGRSSAHLSFLGVRAGPGRGCKPPAGWFDSDYPHFILTDASAHRCDPGLRSLVKWCNSTRRHDLLGSCSNGKMLLWHGSDTGSIPVESTSILIQRSRPATGGDPRARASGGSRARRGRRRGATGRAAW
jgi:hypothetical protein